ncbi:MAG: ABC transporter permease [Rubellimicrobium sp.]|nr:ABC transporter permease [Rubellimicrobium sp.]
MAEFQEEHTLLRRFQHVLHATPSLVPLVVLVVSTLGFGIYLQAQGKAFLSAPTLSLILQQVQIVGIVAAAQTLVILTAGIDLSVGAIMTLSSIVMGQLAVNVGLPTPIALLIGFGVGGGIGFINGWLAARVKLPPFIVTLGTWQIFLAANFLYSRNETIRSQVVREEAPMLQWLGLKPNEQIVNLVERLQGITWDGRRPASTGNTVLDLIWSVNITYGVVVMVVLVFVLAWVLRNTAWGRHVYAVGDDPEAAQLSGVNVKKTLISVYVLAGLICALAGWALIGRIGSISPTSGYDANIQSITAVVIGGISLFGGRGSIMGVFFGGLIVGVFELGLRMAGADAQWTFLLIGALIIGAVAVDQWIRKVAA